MWIHEFVDWCATRDVPVDFLSTHLYPTDYAFGADGAGTAHRSGTSTRPTTTWRVMRAIIDDGPFPDAELHITEWSSSPSSRDRMHDTLFAADLHHAGVPHGRGPGGLASRTGPSPTCSRRAAAAIGPFHGGFGLVNEQGIHKPTFHAMAMLARLGDRLLLSTPDGVITRRSRDGALAAVFVNYPDDMGTTAIGSRITYEATRRAGRTWARAARSSTPSSGLAPGTRLTLEVLDWEHGNVAEAWHQLGEPLNLTPQQTDRLRDVADALHRETLVVPETGVLEIRLDLPPWAVASLVQEE